MEQINLQTLLAQLELVPIKDISKKKVVFQFAGKEVFVANVDDLTIYFGEQLEDNYRLLACRDGQIVGDFTHYQDSNKTSEINPEIETAYELLHSRYMKHRNNIRMKYPIQTEISVLKEINDSLNNL